MDQMLWYTIVLLALTVLPVAFGAFGWLYLASAVVLDALLLRGVCACAP
jgi:protoheme IX farnesyltransferase